MDRHLDLVRNDWDHDTQVRLARVFIGDDDDVGFFVKVDENGEWERQVIEAIDSIGPTMTQTAERITARLLQAFHGPYLVAIEPHSESACAFDQGPVAMKRTPVDGDYHLPALQ